MIDVGHRIRDYEIVARLKAGGMATLFLARRGGAAGFSRHVAIKVVHPHLANNPSFIRMFVDEALLSARIQHPNVVHIEELGEAGGVYFLAMEYVHGAALSALLGELSKLRRRLSTALSVWIAMRVLEGLHAAHELCDETGQRLEVVHRDVSPQNVLLSSNGHVKLIDFGIAKARGQSNRTKTGLLKGKLRYMSPEQARGEAIDRRTDLYALAIMLWEMLTMRRMFPAENDLKLLDMVRDPKIVSPRELEPDVSEALAAVVMQVLRKDPNERPATALDFKRLLSQAMPEAGNVDAPQLAEVMSSVLGARLAQERKQLPESLTGTAPAANAEKAAEIFRSMTISAPHAVLDADTEDTPAPSPPAVIVNGTPSMTPTPIVTMAGPPANTMRWVALAITAVALIALSITGTFVFLSSRPREPDMRNVASVPPPPPQAPAQTPAPVVIVQQVPAQPPVVTPPPEPVAPPPTPRGHPRSHPHDQSHSRVVEGVPIVGW